jgi:Fur family peroxide stress response transcriptional regulator
VSLSTADRESRLAEARRVCQERGVPLTNQRRAVLQALLDRDDHPTADALYEVVVHDLPQISRATVYRSLDALVELGLAARVSHPGSATRFDPTVRRHHHLICDRCGAILDLEDPTLDRIPLPDTRPAGFRARDYSVQVRGLCERCTGGG